VLITICFKKISAKITFFQRRTSRQQFYEIPLLRYGSTNSGWLNAYSWTFSTKVSVLSPILAMECSCEGVSDVMYGVSSIRTSSVLDYAEARMSADIAAE
jgi:hypothetical protein